MLSFIKIVISFLIENFAYASVPSEIGQGTCGPPSMKSINLKGKNSNNRPKIGSIVIKIITLVTKPSNLRLTI